MNHILNFILVHFVQLKSRCVCFKMNISFREKTQNKPQHKYLYHLAVRSIRFNISSIEM